MRFEWMGRQERQYVADTISQVYIELSTACNLSCTTCVRHSIKNFEIAHFKKSMMKGLIAQLQKLQSLKRIVLLGFGEALCNPDIQWHLEQLGTLNVPIVLVTNGMRIDTTLATLFVHIPLEAVYISIDDIYGINPVIRKGGSSDVPLSAIRLIKKIKQEENNTKPLIGIETVATTHNIDKIDAIILTAKEAGAEHCIVSNVFPYTDEMSKNILYTIDGSGDRLTLIRKKFYKDKSVTIAGGSASVARHCPFIEKGTIFITVNGQIAPCPELAYTHTAYYFGNPRVHQKHWFGTITKGNITDIWNSNEYVSFRDTFRYFEFPDCTLCVEPDMCFHRTVENKDCYWNTSPCGECLWAKGIVLCP